MSGLKDYFEIISKEDWKKKYGKIVRSTLDKETYKESKVFLKDLFTKMNGGTFKDTFVMDFETEKVEKLSARDKTLIPILIELGYTVDKQSYLAGKLLKDGKELNIFDVLNSFSSRFKSKNQMEKVYKETKNPNVKKQLDAMEKLENSGFVSIYPEKQIDIRRLSIYNLNKKGTQKIVFSMDPRAIASQSTEVGWRSCMNLNFGEYREKVGSGIAQGVFIAYLTKAGDEMILDNPTARVLIKPFKNKKGDISWSVDQIYGTAPAIFKTQVENFIEKFSSQKIGIYKLSKKIYRDRLMEKKYVYPKLKEEFSEKELKTIKLFTDYNFTRNLKKEFSKTKEVIKKYAEILKDEAVQLEIVRKDPYAIRFFYPTKKVQMFAAASGHGDVYSYVKNPFPEFTLAALKDAPHILEYIPEKNRTPEMIENAVKKEPYVITYVKNPSEKLQLIAVQKDSYAIKEIKNPSKAVQIEAVNRDPELIDGIKNPSKEVQIAAVTKYPKVIKDIKKPDKEVVKIALEKASVSDQSELMENLLSRGINVPLNIIMDHMEKFPEDYAYGSMQHIPLLAKKFQKEINKLIFDKNIIATNYSGTATKKSRLILARLKRKVLRESKSK